MVAYTMTGSFVGFVVVVVGISTLIGLVTGAAAEMFREPFTVGMALGGGGAVVALVIASLIYESGETDRRANRIVMARLIAEIATAVEPNDELNGNTLTELATVTAADARGDDDAVRDTLATVIRFRQAMAEAESKSRRIDQWIARRDAEARRDEARRDAETE